MNTPAHVVLAAVALGRGRWRGLWLPITAGALVPDLPMLIFYLHHRLVLGTPEALIWNERYFEPAWQAFFDVPNSLPLLAVAGWIAWRAASPAWLAAIAAMALHAVSDLAVHREDAHAHLFPLSGWHFVSPVSYWDPAHYGQAFAVFEGALVVGGSLWLMRPASTRGWRGVGAVMLGLYLVFGVFAWLVWIRGGHGV